MRPVRGVMSAPDISETPIPGLLLRRNAIHRDDRGAFAEMWSSRSPEDFTGFHPVQHSIAWNGPSLVTRGIHAEPWQKVASVVCGAIFGAWVDLREGATFGILYYERLNPGDAVLIPEGVGNSYQTLEATTILSYLADDHWKPGRTYPSVDLGDPVLAIPWPRLVSSTEVSDRDQATPPFTTLSPLVSHTHFQSAGEGDQL